MVTNIEASTDVSQLITELTAANAIIKEAEDRKEKAAKRLQELLGTIKNALDNKEERVATIPVESMANELSSHIMRCLKEAGIQYIGQLVELTEVEVQQISNLGPNGFPPIKKALTERGLTLRQAKNLKVA